MLLLRWFINALSLMIVAEVVPGISVHSFWSALVAALILGLVNATVRWVLILLTLPLNIVTLGLFTFVVNALMLMLVSAVVKGFDITSFAAALTAAIVLWLISLITNWFIRDTAAAE